jgi:hypothetical protein
MLAIFGPPLPSTMSSERRDLKFVPDVAEYTSLVRVTRCDAQGNFAFDKVADGEFYVQNTSALVGS